MRKKYELFFCFKDEYGNKIALLVNSDSFINFKIKAIKKLKKILNKNKLSVDDVRGCFYSNGNKSGYVKYYLEPEFYDWNEGK